MEYFGLKLGQDFGNRAAHPYQKFRGEPLPPGNVPLSLILWPFSCGDLYRLQRFTWLVERTKERKTKQLAPNPKKMQLQFAKVQRK